MALSLMTLRITSSDHVERKSIRQRIGSKPCTDFRRLRRTTPRPLPVARFPDGQTAGRFVVDRLPSIGNHCLTGRAIFG